MPFSLSVIYLHGDSMPSHGLTSPQSTDCRDQVLDEAARLKAEIHERGTELAELEKLAGSVSSSRQASRFHSTLTAYLTLAASTSSLPTGKIIDGLQKEIDQLKLARAAAVQGLASEKRTREVLQVKCDDLGITVGSLRTQINNQAYQLRRHEQNLEAMKTANVELKESVLQLREELLKQKRVISIQDDEIKALRIQNQVVIERKEQVAQEYLLLSRAHQDLRQRTMHDISAFRQELAVAKLHYSDEQIQVRSAKEDIILLNEKQACDINEMHNMREELIKTHREQISSLAQAIHDSARDVKLNLQVQEAHEEFVREIRENLQY